MLLHFAFYSPYLSVTLDSPFGFHDWSLGFTSQPPSLIIFLLSILFMQVFLKIFVLFFSRISVPLVICGRITWWCISSTFRLNSKTVYSTTFQPPALGYPTKTSNSPWPTLNLSLTINQFLNCSLIHLLDFSLSEWFWHPPS